LRIPAHVSAERRADLFHEFERLDRNVNNNVEGTGSGLAISVRLAAMMGGYLGHADNPAGGNVFWLELPLVAGTADEAKNGMPAPSSVDLLKTAHTDTAAQTAAASLAARVLVVDDMVTNRDIARAFLRVAGYQVDCVENGEKAIAAAAAKDYDVVLMDVHLPGMDGMEASRRIRALTGARGQVPIIALTARVLAQQVEECRKAGMDSYLGKPFAQRGYSRRSRSP
jgi:two-component system, sensor histidine kinase